MSFDLKVSNGDLVLNNASLTVIRNTDKLLQDILKICLTAVGSNPLHPFYGSYVSRTLIGSYLEPLFISTLAKSQLQNCLDTLKQLQTIQVQQGQSVSPDEQLATVNDISITRNSLEPRAFNIRIQVFTKTFRKVDTTFKVSPI